MKPKHINGHYVQFSKERELMSVDGFVVGRRISIRGPRINTAFSTSSKEVRKWKWLRAHLNWMTR